MSWNYIASQSLQSAKDWWIGVEMTSMNYIAGMHNNCFETALYANRVQRHFILHLPCTDGRPCNDIGISIKLSKHIY